MIVPLILNTIKTYGGTITVAPGPSLHVVPALACSDELAELIGDNKAAVIEHLSLHPLNRPKVKGYLQWQQPGYWVWSEAPDHILVTRRTAATVVELWRQRAVNEMEVAA